MLYDPDPDPKDLQHQKRPKMLVSICHQQPLAPPNTFLTFPLLAQTIYGHLLPSAFWYANRVILRPRQVFFSFSVPFTKLHPQKRTALHGSQYQGRPSVRDTFSVTVIASKLRLQTRESRAATQVVRGVEWLGVRGRSFDLDVTGGRSDLEHARN